MVSYFIGVYIINRTLHGRLEIRNFSSRVENISTLEEKFRISAQPCNILYIFNNYSTSACWIWVGFNHLISNKRYCFIKNAHKNWEFFLTPFVRTTDFQLSADAYSYHMFIIWRAWYSGSYTMMAKPIRALELHYPLIQFLINCIFFFLFTDFFDSPQQTEQTEQTSDPRYFSFLLCYVSQHCHSNIIICKLWKPFWKLLLMKLLQVYALLSCQNCHS